MKHIITILALISGSAYAACTSYGNQVSCTDGSHYGTYGNTTQGYNAQTGSTWSQSTFGNTTQYRDSHGHTKSCTTIGNTTSCY